MRTKACSLPFISPLLEMLHQVANQKLSLNPNCPALGPEEPNWFENRAVGWPKVLEFNRFPAEVGNVRLAMLKTLKTSANRLIFTCSPKLNAFASRTSWLKLESPHRYPPGKLIFASGFFKASMPPIDGIIVLLYVSTKPANALQGVPTLTEFGFTPGKRSL